MKLFDRFYCTKNSVVLMVDGGFASQLTKYLIGAYIKRNCPKAKISYDLTWFKHHGKDINNKETRSFVLTDVFKNLSFDLAHKRQRRYLKHNKRHCNQTPFTNTEQALSFSLPQYVDGYYSHWEYFKDFDFGSLEFSDSIINNTLSAMETINKRNNTVAVHVRRGDFVGYVHDVLDENYYISAIEKMQAMLPDSHFIFFSNGMEWVKEKILPKVTAEITIFEKNDNDSGFNDFYLISKCKHQIISNSGFSYFAALLNTNKNKIVISPSKWINSDDMVYKGHDSAMAVPGWVII